MNLLKSKSMVIDFKLHDIDLLANWWFHINRKKSGKVKTAYKREYVNLGCDVDFDFAGPTIHGAAVAGYEGWLAGYQMTFDTAKSKMTQSNFAVGYKTGDFQLHTNVWVKHLLAQTDHKWLYHLCYFFMLLLRWPWPVFFFCFKQRWSWIRRLHLSEGEWQAGDGGKPGLDRR